MNTPITSEREVEKLVADLAKEGAVNVVVEKARACMNEFADLIQDEENGCYRLVVKGSGENGVDANLAICTYFACVDFLTRHLGMDAHEIVVGIANNSFISPYTSRCLSNASIRKYMRRLAAEEVAPTT